MQGFDKINPVLLGGDAITVKIMAAGGHICRRTGTIFRRTQVDH